MLKTVSLSTLLCFFSIFLVHAQSTTSLGADSGDQGNNNTLIGFRAGQNTTTNSNSFFGSNAGRFNIDGRNNVYLGVNAGLDNQSGLNNILIGVNSGRRTTGNNNSFLGHASGSNITTGVRNTFIGARAGLKVANGNGNIFIGFDAGPESSDNTAVISNSFYVDNSNTNRPLLFGRFNTDQLGVNVESVPQGVTFAVGGNTLVDGTLTTNGKIAIGTTEDDPGYDFTVKGKIHVQEVKVDLEGVIAPDYVFYEDYDLKSIKEVEEFITREGHLPNIPSAAEMKENGVFLKEMNLKLLEKIEELTLYTIAQDKSIDEQKAKVNMLEKRLARLESLLQED